MNLFNTLSEALTSPFLQPLDPSKRFFWVFILSSVVLAIAVVWFEKKHITATDIKNLLFSRRYWINKSSAIDLYYLFLNSLLKAIFIIPLIGSHVGLSLFFYSVLQNNFESPDVGHVPWYLIGALYSLSFFVIEDLSRFLLHRCMHYFPFLWHFHQVHHSAKNLTPLTLNRVHPVEMTLYYLRGTFVFGTVSGLFFFLFANQLTAFDILGVDLLGFLFNILGANLRHSHIWLSFGRFEKLFISPAQHQIHHSSAPEHQDKNFGTYIALWDRMAGSLVFSGRKKRLHFGLSAQQDKPSLPLGVRLS